MRFYQVFRITDSGLVAVGPKVNSIRQAQDLMEEYELTYPHNRYCFDEVDNK